MPSGKLLGSVIPSLTSAVNKSGSKDSANGFCGDQPVKSVVDLVR